MSTQISLENYEEIYSLTYKRVQSYIVCNCFNIEDVNDLIQETYVELYIVLKRKKYIVLENYQNFVIGIAKRKMQRHYGLLSKLKTYSFFNVSDENEYELDVPSNVDIEAEIITKLNAEEVWQYIKKKDIRVIKVFYLYYYLEVKISQIAKDLRMTESNVKNILYRTIKDIRNNIKIER